MERKVVNRGIRHYSFITAMTLTLNLSKVIDEFIKTIWSVRVHQGWCEGTAYTWIDPYQKLTTDRKDTREKSCFLFINSFHPDEWIMNSNSILITLWISSDSWSREIIISIENRIHFWTVFLLLSKDENKRWSNKSHIFFGRLN